MRWSNSGSDQKFTASKSRPLRNKSSHDSAPPAAPLRPQLHVKRHEHAAKGRPKSTHLRHLVRWPFGISAAIFLRKCTPKCLRASNEYENCTHPYAFFLFFFVWIGKRKRIKLPYATKGFRTQALTAEISSSWGADRPGVKLICEPRQICPKKPQIQYLVAC
uniref:HDC05849 n=1 Tax=Drosophila melanogaster TaxID=7227 RepID=Q6IGN3_DROME|nr:TPA_inf: HDC05849 [Drosophila melanogaster]